MKKKAVKSPAEFLDTRRKRIVRGAIVKGIDFSHRDLSLWCFRKCVFEGCNFTKTIFRSADMRNSRFLNCCFSGAILEFANVANAIFKNCQCEEADARNANMVGAVLENVAIRDVNVEGAALGELHIKECHVENLKGRGSSCENAYISDSDLTKVDLSGSDLTGTIVTRVKFCHVDFRGSINVGISIRKCSFAGCLFFGARVREATGISNELYDMIRSQEGMIVRGYIQRLWAHFYGKIMVGVAGLLILFALGVVIFDPRFQSSDELLRIVTQANEQKQYVKAERLLQILQTRNLVGEQGSYLKLRLGEIYRATGQRNEAMLLFDSILQEGGFYVLDALASTASMFRDDNNYAEALETYEKFLVLVPVDSLDQRLWVMGEIIDTYVSMNDSVRALQLCDEIILDPELDEKKKGRTYLQRGTICWSAGDRIGAMANYKIAKTFSNEWFALSARESIAGIYKEEGEFAKALEEYEELLGFISRNDDERSKRIKELIRETRKSVTLYSAKST